MNGPRIFRISRYPTYLRQFWWGLFLPQKLKMQGVQLAKDVTFHGAPIVTLTPGSDISIGPNAVLCSVSNYTALGVNHPVVLRTLSETASISIGKDVGMSGTTVCAMSSVMIGDESLIGANVAIVDTDFHPIVSTTRRYDSEPANINSKPIVIGRNVFIGMNSLILKGVTIGDNSVVGAGSVVVGDIPSNTIAGGNPAVPLKLIGD